MNIAIFASGSGSNAENIINYFSNRNDVHFPFILSNNKESLVHERAKKLGIPSHCFTKEELNETNTVLDLLVKNKIDFIVLAGFLLKMPDNLIEVFPNKIINIHPALLPKYGGKGMFGNHVHKAVVAAGEKESGISIHYINEFYDEGQIIFQVKCPVFSSDTAEDVANKVHELEYEFYPQIIEKIIDKKALDN
jgi:phosphoribosylglycinamide formyltransferase-1